MTDDMHKNDAALEALFESARATPPAVPEALMARVLADAEALQPRAPRRGFWGFVADLGGVPALGGMITASCVGFWLGVAPPAGLPDLAGQALGFETAADDDFEGGGLSGFGWDIAEDVDDG